jgi:hypothetical protein
LKIERGGYRLVIFLGDYVIKIPQLASFRVFCSLPSYIYKKQLRLFGPELEWAWARFKEALVENTSEYRCWRRTKAKFLAPTIFSLGFVNLQKREVGTHPDNNQRLEIIKKLSDKTRDIFKIDQHCTNPLNFVKNERGCILVDYGNSPDGDLDFTVFIERHQIELERILCASSQTV